MGRVSQLGANCREEPGADLSLPLELWQRVLFFVDAWLLEHDEAARVSGERTRRATLYALSLVSSPLHHIAQPHLYSFPCLSDGDALDEGRQQRYWAAICAKPALWSYARGIFLGRRRTGPEEAGQEGSGSLASLQATTVRARSLAQAISGSSTSSSAWAESFGVIYPRLPTPIGIGPSPSCLTEVAWWEVGGGVGGLPASHAYSTRAVGGWCRDAFAFVEQQKRQQRAMTVEDVDLGRGPGQGLMIGGATSGVHREDRTSAAPLHQVSPYTLPARAHHSHQSEQPTDLSEDDMWAAAERLSTQHTSKPPIAASASRNGDMASDSEHDFRAPLTTGLPRQREDLHDEWLRVARYQQERLQRAHERRQLLRGSSQCAPQHATLATPHLVPWRYRLTLGSLDSCSLPHLLCSLPTLTHVHLTLYLGTHLDHDLLEHQLRLCLDTSQRLPLLRCLEVRVGHDARGGGAFSSRLARAAFERTVKGAVERVGDARCAFFGDINADAAEGGGPRLPGDGSRLVNVRGDAVTAWARDVDESRWGSYSDEEATESDVSQARGKPWINGWLARDRHGTNDPIEE